MADSFDLMPEFCSGFGQFHSPKNKIKPLDYATITLSGIEAMAANPPRVPKDQAQWVIFSTLLSRVHGEQQQHGKFWCIWSDFDETGGLSFDDIVSQSGLCVLGRFLAYTSRSATQDSPKTRLLIPLSKEVDGVTYCYLAKILNNKLAEAGLTPDRVTERAGQICYLPNRGDYYRYRQQEGSLFDPDAWAEELVAEQQQHQDRLKDQEAASARSLLVARERMASGCQSPVDAFNAAYPIPQMFDAYGYKKIGNRWLSPNSASRTPGVTLSDDGKKWMSSHDSDSGIGRVTDCGSMGDAFDLFVYYEHKGDRRAATIAAGALFSASQGVSITQSNQRVFMASREPVKNENLLTPPKKGERGANPHGQTIYWVAKDGRIGENFAPPVYPVESLGALSGMCRYIVEELQLSSEVAGQSVLAAASLLTQGLYDVETLMGVKPLSLNFLTIIDSGDGKSTAEGEALSDVNQVNMQHDQRYKEDLLEWMALSKRQKESTPKPLHHYRTMKIGTIQGITDSLRDGRFAQGNFSAEASSMLSGWGMSAEQMKNTLGRLNELWDGEPISIVTKGEGQTRLYDKRFNCHWMIQPDAAQESLDNEIISSIGTWPRFLVAWPNPMAPRSYKKQSFSNAACEKYRSTCRSLINKGAPDERKVIRLTDGARDLLIAFWEEMEESRKPLDDYFRLKSFCVRGAEQVCRIAGVLAAFRAHHDLVADFEVVAEDIRNAIALFSFSLDTWKGIFIGRRDDDTHQEWADCLHKWLMKQPHNMATETAMLKRMTPKHMRSQHKRDTAIALLQSQERIREGVERDQQQQIIRRLFKTWEAI